MSFSAKAEKAGEDTVKSAKSKANRVRTRLETDENLRRNLLIGGITTLVAGVVGLGGWFLFKRRDDIKKGLKGARDTIKEKIDHRSSGNTKGAAH
ncbi:hypothetical protein TSOC_008094 [Tetrabaena socialis]|uniref:Uncharacterized protein n=1 Tax=Tetrabaena socialis TaxID=47790 RepID=A0A2J7ZZE2_9CHLO|nr:hypothetical protein TSOC_008094 [Tetrabaena socialis]|eukprot:PNH05616.1 hypothetical protein TSOC_008094 [Tetrabaena socialis]